MIYEEENTKQDNEFKPKKTKSHNAKMYQNIIIGGGLLGLLSGILVSKDRSSTLLLEKNNYLGGYVYTHCPIHENHEFFFDNWWPLDLSEDTEAYSLLDYMNGFKRFSAFKTKNMFIYKNLKESFIIPNGGKKLLYFIRQKHPLVSNELNIFFDDLEKIRSDHNYLLNQKFKETNAHDYLNNLFKKDLSVLFIFNLFWPFFNIDYKNLDIYIFLYNISHYLIGGFHYIHNGSEKMINTLEEICHVHGINIKLNTEVKEIKNNSSSLKSLKCMHLVNKNTTNFTGETYVVSSPLENFVNCSRSKDHSLLEYKSIIHKKENSNKHLTEITIMIGLDVKPSHLKINESAYYFDNIYMNDTSEITNYIIKNGYSSSPIIIYNQNNIYNLANKFSGSLLIKMYDNFDHKIIAKDIESYIKSFLDIEFPNLSKHIIYLKTELPIDLSKRLNRNYGNYSGQLATPTNGWLDRTYQTVFNNVLLGSIDGVPGTRGNSIFLTSKYLSNVNDVGLNKFKKFSDLDHMTSSEIMNFLVSNYEPHPKYFGKTIGITLDEKDSFFLRILPDKVEIKKIDFDKAMESNYYIWTFNSAIKDILSSRSSVMRKVFRNKMRVKGGAFYLNSLMKKCFKNAFINNK